MDLSVQTSGAQNRPSDRGGRAPWTVAAVVALVGLSVGALSFLVQGRLPGDWSYLGNSGAVWLAPAFFMGALVRRSAWAAVAGLGTLAACLIGYFAAGSLAGVPYYWVTIAYWVGVALIGGPIFGLAGHWWRGPQRWQRVLALALLGGVYIAEGLYSLLVNSHLSVGWPLIAVGVLVPLVVGRTWRDRLWGLAALVPVALLGGAAYAILLWINFAMAGV